jgi:AcrR family transcriptional regulator
VNLRAKQAEQTREAILDAAEELILSDADPHAITMQAIADQAGVSHRTLYRYFETKGDLIDAMGRRMDGRLNLASNIEEPLDFETWTNGVEGMVRFGVLNREMLRVPPRQGPSVLDPVQGPIPPPRRGHGASGLRCATAPALRGERRAGGRAVRPVTRGPRRRHRTRGAGPGARHRQT